MTVSSLKIDMGLETSWQRDIFKTWLLYQRMLWLRFDFIIFLRSYYITTMMLAVYVIIDQESIASGQTIIFRKCVAITFEITAGINCFLMLRAHDRVQMALTFCALTLSKILSVTMLTRISPLILGEYMGVGIVLVATFICNNWVPVREDLTIIEVACATVISAAVTIYSITDDYFSPEVQIVVLAIFEFSIYFGIFWEQCRLLLMHSQLKLLQQGLLIAKMFLYLMTLHVAISMTDQVVFLNPCTFGFCKMVTLPAPEDHF
ncbi:membrane protein S19 [Saimiriine betaherpesvirus 4]|uniref:Membrane protein S19 n=1 Tax=Saimiriine betaherpesvirus 4 TaxID=1535247 RepID=G8XT40_9BETA|nr:membrane protein S19 [Saimiriine betaherpesvirus 4]AEV80991.1 membrane protein S19 [Saimiriine betaherpesvirus 4]